MNSFVCWHCLKKRNTHKYKVVKYRQLSWYRSVAEESMLYRLQTRDIVLTSV